METIGRVQRSGLWVRGLNLGFEVHGLSFAA